MVEQNQQVANKISPSIFSSVLEKFAVENQLNISDYRVFIYWAKCAPDYDPTHREIKEQLKMSSSSVANSFKKLLEMEVLLLKGYRYSGKLKSPTKLYVFNTYFLTKKKNPIFDKKPKGFMLKSR